MPRFGIGAKRLVFSAIIFAGYAFLAGLASHKIHQTISAERVEAVRHLDETAVAMVKSAYARAQSGEMTEDAAKKMVKDQIRIMRWGNGEYYYIHDFEGTNIVHGGKPEREGQNFINFVDPSGRQIIKEQIEAARESWQHETVAPALAKFNLTQSPERFYSPSDLGSFDFLRKVGFPGQFPYTAGPWVKVEGLS